MGFEMNPIGAWHVLDIGGSQHAAITSPGYRAHGVTGVFRCARMWRHEKGRPPQRPSGTPQSHRRVYLVILASLLAGLLLAVAAVGPRYLRGYRTIKRQFDAEQDYVDRVKKEAEGGSEEGSPGPCGARCGDWVFLAHR